MIKKVKIHDLRPGMYIHNLDCGWMDHPFACNCFRVGERDAAKLSAWGIHEVYIDTELGLDVADEANARTSEEIQQAISQHMLSLATEGTMVFAESVPLPEELEKAETVCREAHGVVQSLLASARMGKRVEVERLQPVVTAMTESILRNPDAILGLTRIKRADHYTFQHSVSVAALLIAFCHALELDTPAIEAIGVGGLLHDIGKMKVPSALLNKPGRLNETEFSLMKEHVAYGGRILESATGISVISLEVLAQHHERYDGTGYPCRLQGETIALHGHMAAIADVYDALTSDRVYHQGEAPTYVLQKLLEWSEYHFHPRLVQSFIRVIGIYPVGTLVRLESGRLAVVSEQRRNDLLRPKVKIVYNIPTGTYLPPKEVDLSASDANDHIVAFELASKWQIDPSHYI
jgi:putative nucleotidyltransferase with HDIG domain